MLKWKPTSPDNVLASTEVAPMLSEIICTFGFIFSSRYLFAHQHHPCLHCCNLTDAQTSSKKRSWVFIYSLPVVLVLYYLVCLPAWSKRREGRLNALANPKVLSSFSSKSPVQMQSQQWPTILDLLQLPCRAPEMPLTLPKHIYLSRNPVAVWLAAMAQKLGTELAFAFALLLDKAMAVLCVGHVGPQRTSFWTLC